MLVAQWAAFHGISWVYPLTLRNSLSYKTIEDSVTVPAGRQILAEFAVLL